MKWEGEELETMWQEEKRSGAHDAVGGRTRVNRASLNAAQAASRKLLLHDRHLYIDIPRGYRFLDLKPTHILPGYVLAEPLAQFFSRTVCT
jgi:hypothetical protein